MKENIEEKGSMKTVVMRKEELVKKLIENRAAHDIIYDNAVRGYWDAAKKKLEDKQNKITSDLQDYKYKVDSEFDLLYSKIENKKDLPDKINLNMNFWDLSLSLAKPENYSGEYDRAIAMMNASIYDTVELTVQEFDSFVLNNWSWKKSFLNSNSLYITGMCSGIYGNHGAQGPTGEAGPAGASYGNAYRSFSDKTVDDIWK